MNKISIRLILLTLTFTLGLLSAAGWLCYREAHRVTVILPADRWVPLFFKEIDRVTALGELSDLRQESLTGGDLEVRVWRGFSYSQLEAVVLKRRGDEWSALHLKTNKYDEPEDVEVTELKPPRSGWEVFWEKLTDCGLLTLPDVSETSIDSRKWLDGTSYVVEINQNNIYRTYMYHSGEEAPEGRQIDKIGEIIGLEFDTGKEKCQDTEWFSCTTLRHLIDSCSMNK